MPTPDPVAFTIFNIEIMWYAILITAGMILAVIISCKRAPVHGLDSDQVLNFVIICIPSAIIGARLYYVIFNWSYYAGDIMKIINIREGGLAIHGGLIFGFGVAVILCCIWKVRPLNALDLVVPAVALAQSIGRWGNYFNSEAHGGPTDLPWAITVDGVSVHPTFLYESIWCFILFFLLLYIDNRRKFERPDIPFICDTLFHRKILRGGTSNGQPHAGPFRQAQLLSIALIIVCAAAYIILARRSSRAATDHEAAEIKDSDKNKTDKEKHRE